MCRALCITILFNLFVSALSAMEAPGQKINFTPENSDILLFEGRLELPVLKEGVQLSGTLRPMVEKATPTDRTIPLAQISAEIGQLITNFMNSYAQVHAKIRNTIELRNAMQQALPKNITTEVLDEILQAADYLEMPLLIEAWAVRFANELQQGTRSLEALKKFLQPITQENRDILLAEIGRQYYVLYKKFLDIGVDYGLTVKDYLDTGLLAPVIERIQEAIRLKKAKLANPFIETKYEHIVLNFANSHLSSLEGLTEIPGIEEITVLNLQNNLLKKIDPDVFKKAVNLEILGLHQNPLREVTSANLKDLPKFNKLIIDAKVISPSEKKKLMEQHPGLTIQEVSTGGLLGKLKGLIGY